mmetsp:Transcript_77488/g.240020  ORF Transcript_77488/g.240020 Transcript_77488/m.240020 type:complete len:221 (+) Transcript_77488:195-857(+)
MMPLSGPATNLLAGESWAVDGQGQRFGTSKHRALSPVPPAANSGQATNIIADRSMALSEEGRHLGTVLHLALRCVLDTSTVWRDGNHPRLHGGGWHSKPRLHRGDWCNQSRLHRGDGRRKPRLHHRGDGRSQPRLHRGDGRSRDCGHRPAHHGHDRSGCWGLGAHCRVPLRLRDLAVVVLIHEVEEVRPTRASSDGRATAALLGLNQRGLHLQLGGVCDE